jgi:hypothetical protein
MKPAPEELRRVVLASLTEEGVALPTPLPDPTELRLIGPGALLRSVALVAMLVGVEQRLQEEFGVGISLMDEHAMSQSRSPFRSVATLVEYLEGRLGGGA